MEFIPCLIRPKGPAVEGGAVVQLGHPLLDAYLRLVAARARPNTLLAQAYDLKVFFSVVRKDPTEVESGDVLSFIASQREPRAATNVVRIEDGEAGLSARTIKRRLATISGLYDYLVVRGDTGLSANPVPRGLATRRPGDQTVPLIRTSRTLPSTGRTVIIEFDLVEE
ncbi:MAG: hypothetical protein GEU79_19320 [Acidimicrobiia bacterium]|nr:hypothetical protein [Acidimicrobiia bacterium]